MEVQPDTAIPSAHPEPASVSESTTTMVVQADTSSATLDRAMTEDKVKDGNTGV